MNSVTKPKYRASPTNKCIRFLDCILKSGFRALVIWGLPVLTVLHVFTSCALYTLCSDSTKSTS